MDAAVRKPFQQAMPPQTTCFSGVKCSEGGVKSRQHKSDGCINCFLVRLAQLASIASFDPHRSVPLRQLLSILNRAFLLAFLHFLSQSYSTLSFHQSLLVLYPGLPEQYGLVPCGCENHQLRHSSTKVKL